ncbi:MAG: calcium-binding protein [Woeseiaceae bacterium]
MIVTKYRLAPLFWFKLTGSLMALALGANASAQVANTVTGTDQNALFGVDDNIQSFLSANRGDAGGGDQSLQGGDAVEGTEDADLLIGALGIDVLFGNGGDDVLIGGTEDFNPFNRDRAFGGSGDDAFIWAPGDGNDFFDGGEGTDVLLLGLVGEQRDATGNTEGAPFFAVNPPNRDGSQDFDGIFTDASSGLPLVDIANGPGFCEVVDGSTDAAEQATIDDLELDHIVRFTLRGPAADAANPDTGLRIAVHLTNTEFLVCGGETAGEVVVLDLTTSPPTPSDVSQLPRQSFDLITTR